VPGAPAGSSSDLPLDLIDDALLAERFANFFVKKFKRHDLARGRRSGERLLRVGGQGEGQDRRAEALELAQAQYTSQRSRASSQMSRQVKSS
jgi:hypothetical protein